MVMFGMKKLFAMPRLLFSTSVWRPLTAVEVGVDDVIVSIPKAKTQSKRKSIGNENTVADDKGGKGAADDSGCSSSWDSRGR